MTGFSLGCFREMRILRKQHYYWSLRSGLKYSQAGVEIGEILTIILDRADNTVDSSLKIFAQKIKN